MLFIKLDCRLQAVVPLSDVSHGIMKSTLKAREYERIFRTVMEKLMRGEWATPDWWKKPDDIKSFEQNLLRLGYIKPNN